MKILIIGYGISGKSLYEYLKGSGDEIYIYDENIISDDIYNYDRLLKEQPYFELGIKSPGIRKNTKEYELISILCKEIISEIDYSYLKLKTKNVIGITGSNGKTTFSQFLYEFYTLKYNAYLGGNIGIPLIDLVNKVKKDDYVILELSSFQLEDSKYLKLKKGFITSLSPNHLNYYDNVNHYFASKNRIKLFSLDVVYLNNYIFDNDFKLTPLVGSYNNLYKKIAFNEAYKSGVELSKLYHKEKQLKLDLYRLNGPYLVNNFIIINDSKSTSSESTLYAYNTFKNYKIILILGGNHKSDSFSKINVKDGDMVLIYGASKDKIKSEINGMIFNTLEEIIIYISKLKNEYMILFSPGCDSHDQFKNYINRGKVFNQLIKKHIGDFNE